MRIQTVVINVEGGVVHLVRKSRGVRLIVRDYDVEGETEEGSSKLKVDKNGDSYAEAVFEANGTARGLSLRD